jgi:hypothetical protein
MQERTSAAELFLVAKGEDVDGVGERIMPIEGDVAGRAEGDEEFATTGASGHRSTHVRRRLKMREPFLDCQSR